MFNTAAIKLFPDMVDFMGFAGTYYVYTGVSVAMAIWGFVTIPDNRGKTLVQVEQFYEEGQKS